MLQRIYGISFPKASQLEEYITMIEEAQKRDHRKLGKELELFFFDETAPGMAYWLPKGFTMLNTLIEFWRKEHQKRGYQEFSAPQLNSSVSVSYTHLNKHVSTNLSTDSYIFTKKVSISIN